MREIDLEPKAYSQRFELKPMSRWWLVGAGAFAIAMAVASGPFSASTWAMFAAGVIVTCFAVLCFPRTFLSKTR